MVTIIIIIIIVKVIIINPLKLTKKTNNVRKVQTKQVNEGPDY